MYIYGWMYNTLSRWARRIKMITSVFITLGMMMIPIGFIIMTMEVSRLWVWVAGIIGFTCLILLVIRANKEDKRKEAMHRELIEALGEIGEIGEKVVRNTRK